MLPKKRKPTHPGVVLLEDFLKPLGSDAKKFAASLGQGWTEKKVQDIIEGKEHVSQKAAETFANALQTSTNFWVSLQQHFTQFEERERENVKGAIKPWKKAM